MSDSGYHMYPVVLLICLLFILLSCAITTQKDLAIMYNKNLLSVFLIALFIIFKSINYHVLKEGVSLFGGFFINTNLTMVSHGFIIFISFIVIQLTAYYPPGSYSVYIVPTNDSCYFKMADKFPQSCYSEVRNEIKVEFNIIEYPLIILFIVIGAIFLISSSDTISLFLSLELQSYGLYLLCALYRNSESSTGAGLTYFLLGGLSSCIILLAIGILYANSGTTCLDNYYILISLSEYTTNNLVSYFNGDYINYSLVLLSIGLLFKISASPFHFWSPYVYDAIPTIVTAFVANGAKISILIFLMGLAYYTGNLVITNFNWTNCLLLSSLLSLVIGTVLGLYQSKMKKLLAYSTVSHLGFMLLAISINSIESIQAFSFYLMQYLLTSVNAFIIIIHIGYTFSYFDKNNAWNRYLSGIKSNPTNWSLQEISQLKGHYYIDSFTSISFTIVMFSFVGIPPLIGFFGKQMVLSCALDKGYIFITLVAILTSVISAVYYLNTVKEIFFSKPTIEYKSKARLYKYALRDIYTPGRIKELIIVKSLAVTISILTLINLLFMANPDEWLRITNILAILMFN